MEMKNMTTTNEKTNEKKMSLIQMHLQMKRGQRCVEQDILLVLFVRDFLTKQ